MAISNNDFYRIEQIGDVDALANGFVSPQRVDVSLDRLSRAENEYWSSRLTREATECGCRAAAKTMTAGVGLYVATTVGLVLTGRGVTLPWLVGGLFAIGVLGTVAKIVSKERARRRFYVHARDLLSAVETEARRSEGCV